MKNRPAKCNVIIMTSFDPKIGNHYHEGFQWQTHNFSDRGCQPKTRGHQSITLANFSRKLHKRLDQGVRLWHPIGSVNGLLVLNLCSCALPKKFLNDNFCHWKSYTNCELFFKKFFVKGDEQNALKNLIKVHK